jgi:hypothetical protein
LPRERFLLSDFAPLSTDAATSVVSKDVAILPEAGVLARIYLPAPPSNGRNWGKAPGFSILPRRRVLPWLGIRRRRARKLIAWTDVIVLFVEYHLTPECLVPALYGDGWAALQWVAAHAEGQGPEPCLTTHADFRCVHLGIESVSANIVHHAAMRPGTEDLGHDVKVNLLVLIHPFFLGGASSEMDEMGMALLCELVRLWPVVCPRTSGCDDPWINLMVEGVPSLSVLGASLSIVILSLAHHLALYSLA